MILQRPEELDGLAADWLGDRRPRRPTVYLEHNAPQGRIAEMRHPAADRDEVDLSSTSRTSTTCSGTAARRRRASIEHGIVDPGYRYSGEIDARRGRHQRGAPPRPRDRDRSARPLRGRWRAARPVRHGGRRGHRAGAGIEDLPQARLHDELARRRVYLHPIRWTSLGLSLHRGDAARDARRGPRDDRGARGRARRRPASSRPASTCWARRSRGFVREPERARDAGLAARSARARALRARRASSPTGTTCSRRSRA